jgi:hypothetical protein
MYGSPFRRDTWSAIANGMGALLQLLKKDVRMVVRARHSWRHIFTAMLCLFVGIAAAERQPLAQEVPQRPNILFILTDD